MLQMNKYLSYFFILCIFLLIYEILHGYKRQTDRIEYYNMAVNKSKQLNKPLIVYGDPYNGTGSKIYNTFMKIYGCGDECVDLTGCPKCMNGKKQDILYHLKQKPDNSSVIFISCVLEYIPHIEEVIPEILRVAGSWDNVFVVTVNKNAFSAYLYKNKQDVSRNIVFAPPQYKEISYIKLRD